jgi:hypothetical protein
VSSQIEAKLPVFSTGKITAHMPKINYLLNKIILLVIKISLASDQTRR